MEFVDRIDALSRLDAVTGAGLVAVWGRRRIGKTRLLLEWSRRRHGLYFVADESAPSIQRRYFAEAVAEVVPDFAAVEYPDWRSFLRALAREASRGAIAGPVIIDELPYLVQSSPSLPSVLQNFVDHEAREAGLLLVLAGSSQRMMQGLVLDAKAPLFGRARELIKLSPLPAGYMQQALGLATAHDSVKAYAVWGGIPRYWELAKPFGGELDSAVDRLVLDPMAPLHREPDQLLLEEQPPATALRPLLDAIGAGANRLSEIAGRVGQPATSLTRPLGRLLELELVRRELPYGAVERSSKRALYRINDPFFRFWFRVVAPHRGLFASSPAKARLHLWRQSATWLFAQAWEDLCRQAVPSLDVLTAESTEPLGVASRSWHGSDPEWDIVAERIATSGVILGEVKWHDGPVSEATLEQAYRDLLRKDMPGPSVVDSKGTIVHAVFVPECPRPLKRKARPYVVVDATDVMRALR